MHSLVRCTCLLISFFLPALALANTWNSAERTRIHEIESVALGETRTVIVRTPPSYEPGRQYPVVFVPDARVEF